MKLPVVLFHLRGDSAETFPCNIDLANNSGILHNVQSTVVVRMSVDLTKVFSRRFFLRPTLKVAPDLLGAVLCRRLDTGEVLQAPIIEVEAYTQDDPACHAFKGKTSRCEVMFGPGGFSYVYFIYGMYNCLNVVTEQEGKPGAVLIRAIETEGGDGPGKLCKNWDIDRSHNGLDLSDCDGPLWLVQGSKAGKGRIACSPRVGISQAQDRLWRFYIEGHPGLSVQKVKLANPGKRAGAR